MNRPYDLALLVLLGTDVTLGATTTFLSTTLFPFSC